MTPDEAEAIKNAMSYEYKREHYLYLFDLWMGRIGIAVVLTVAAYFGAHVLSWLING